MCVCFHVCGGRGEGREEWREGGNKRFVAVMHLGLKNR